MYSSCGRLIQRVWIYSWKMFLTSDLTSPPANTRLLSRCLQKGETLAEVYKHDWHLPRFVETTVNKMISMTWFFPTPALPSPHPLNSLSFIFSPSLPVFFSDKPLFTLSHSHTHIRGTEGKEEEMEGRNWRENERLTHAPCRLCVAEDKHLSRQKIWRSVLARDNGGRLVCPAVFAATTNDGV